MILFTLRYLLVVLSFVFSFVSFVFFFFLFRCLTMLVFVTALWVTEAIPYFVTALLVPVLVVLMDIMEDPHGGGLRIAYHSGVGLCRAASM